MAATLISWVEVESGWTRGGELKTAAVGNAASSSVLQPFSLSA